MKEGISLRSFLFVATKHSIKYNTTLTTTINDGPTTISTDSDDMFGYIYDSPHVYLRMKPEGVMGAYSRVQYTKGDFITLFSGTIHHRYLIYRISTYYPGASKMWKRDCHLWDSEVIQYVWIAHIY